MTKPSNPKRTGGPKTAEGKMVASGNALKTGVYSRLVVLPGEDSAEFEALQRHFLEDFQPNGVVEEAMVYELSTIVWKKLRLDKIEHNLFEEILNKVVTCDELRDVNFYVYSGLSWVLEDREMFDDIDIEEYRQSLQYLRDLDGRSPTPVDVETLKSEYTTAYDELEGLAKQYGYGGASSETLCGLQMTHGDGLKVNLVKHVIKDEIMYAMQLIGLYEGRARLDAAIARVKTDRMLRIVQRADMGLARSHLDARFYKLLSELRKQKDWVRKNRVIDVTPESLDQDGVENAAGE